MEVPATQASPARARARNAVALGLGLGLLAWLLHHVGLAPLVERLRVLGWTAALVPLPYLVVSLADTMGWRAALPARSRSQVRVWTLYMARVAGEAVNSATPTAAVGGEPVKAVLLRRAGIAGPDGVASVVIAKTALVAAQSLFTALGFVALFHRTGRHAMAVGSLVLLSTLAIGFTIALVALQRRNPASAVWRWLRRFFPRAAFVARLEPRVAEVDHRLAEFYHLERSAFARSTAWHLLGWGLGVTETLLLAWLVGAPLPLLDAFIIDGLSQVIRATAVIVPGGLGTQEVGGVALCTYLGMAEADAVTLWLLKRAREVVFDVIGLLYLSAVSTRPAA